MLLLLRLLNGIDKMWFCLHRFVVFFFHFAFIFLLLLIGLFLQFFYEFPLAWIDGMLSRKVQSLSITSGTGLFFENRSLGNTYILAFISSVQFVLLLFYINVVLTLGVRLNRVLLHSKDVYARIIVQNSSIFVFIT